MIGEMNMTPTESREKLIAGNERFTAGKPGAKDLGSTRRQDLSDNGQHPLALVVCCSDSRVPPELIFDQGLGDLFVVRTAGNVVDDVALGSIEYGAEHLHIPLIVVLGHEKCGAVKATVDSARAHEHVHGCIKSITDKIKKSLDKVGDTLNVYEDCTNENIRSTMNEISANKIVGALIREGNTKVVGAKYGISTGKVTFMQ
jgi:carbonic anhydrase